MRHRTNLNYSSFLIKPDGMRAADHICSLMAESGLEIVCSRTQRLTKRDISAIFGIRRFPKIHRAMLGRFLATFLGGHLCQIGIVKGYGNSTIAKLRSLRGWHENPLRCRSTSIRGLYGNRNPDLIEGFFYWRNAFSCADTPEDVARFCRHFDFDVPETEVRISAVRPEQIEKAA